MENEAFEAVGASLQHELNLRDPEALVLDMARPMASVVAFKCQAPRFLDFS